MKKLFLFLIMSIQISSMAYSQIPAEEKRYIKIGSLQTFYSAYGSERAWNDSYYEGLDWPANYDRQDNFVIRRQWIAANNFTDSSGNNWDKYGIYFSSFYEGVSIFPIKIKLTGRFELPAIIVDGLYTTSPEIIDSLDSQLIPDRIITNVVNTSLGLTMTRNIYAFSQQYHDNYFIKEFIFTNTGNVNYDDIIELNAPLDDVYICWGIRYSVCRDGAYKYHTHQLWGKHSWVTKRGEDYPAHANDVITAQNPIVDWLRCGFSWAGQSDVRPDWDNIGAPDKDIDGRIFSPQHAGVVTLHVDSTATYNNDNPYQPHTQGWHAGDTYPSLGSMNPPSEPAMIQLYSMLQGNPHGGAANGGDDRFYENNTSSIIDPVSPWTIHNDGGGTNLWACYGPFDLAPGESIRIVEAEGVNGLSRQMCEQVGAEWKQAYDDPSYIGPFTLPDGSTTTNKDIYKNSWVYTGWDSVLLTFSRAKRNFDSNYSIPQPPPPPATFEVASGLNHILLSWANNATSDPNLAGYKIYRATNKPDTVYNLIFECGSNTNHPALVHSYADSSAEHGFTYYYYVVSYNDGSNNTAGIVNPIGPLHSGKFYTMTNEPAYLRGQPNSLGNTGDILPNQYLLYQNFPNPFNPNSNIRFDLPKQSNVLLEIYDITGRKIRTLINQSQNAGEKSVNWDSINDSGQKVASGLYIYKIVAGQYIESKKMLLMK